MHRKGFEKSSKLASCYHAICSWFTLPSFFQGLAISGAMKYAVEQINNCSSLLPGVQLDFLFNDTKVDRTTFHILPTKSGHLIFSSWSLNPSWSFSSGRRPAQQRHPDRPHLQRHCRFCGARGTELQRGGDGGGQQEPGNDQLPVQRPRGLGQDALPHLHQDGASGHSSDNQCAVPAQVPQVVQVHHRVPEDWAVDDNCRGSEEPGGDERGVHRQLLWGVWGLR